MLFFAGSLQLVWHSGITTGQRSGLASTSSFGWGDCDLHPAQAPLLWPLPPHTFHLGCSQDGKSPDVSSQRQSDYFSELNSECLPPPFILPKMH